MFKKNIEKLDILQGTDHRQHTEQAGQCLEIKITQIGFIRWDDAGSDECRHSCDAYHGIFLYKRRKTVQQ